MHKYGQSNRDEEGDLEYRVDQMETNKENASVNISQS
jgi:hypothetical protein